MKLRRTSRPAFTLLEMMAVIAIIALLAALTVTAVFRVQESQREENTNRTLLKIQVGLDQQRKAALFLIGRENPTSDIKVMTAKDTSGTLQDPQRARALHTKLRMRQEFPQNYAEARYLFKGKYIGLNSAYGPKQVYLAAIGTGSGTPDHDKEAAALLVVTLSQGRGGVTFDVEEVGPTTTIDVHGKQMRVLIDEWGTPIAFRRWVSNDEADAFAELNALPYVTQEQISNNRRDSDDPEGRLPTAWGVAQYKTDARLWFTEPLRPRTYEPFDGMNRGPFVVSAGKDKTFGTADDLYSFRIAGAGKGN